MRTGSLFSGYGGLEEAVNETFGATTAWVSDIDKGACKILAHRYPGVPNLGDITTVDWSRVEPVDILTGGSPCQDLSHAGRRAGMTTGTRSNLWVAMREAIAQLRPRTVVWENVRGAYSAAADSAVEPCPGCVGDRPGVSLRALGRVLGDLSDLGYDCRWHGLRAADVGAPHGRFRVFVVATDTHSGGLLSVRGQHSERRDIDGRGSADEPRATGEPTSPSADATDLGHERPGRARDGRTGPEDSGRGALTLPTPKARDWKGPGQAGALRHDPDLSAITHLLPTPAVNDMGEGKTVERWDEWTDEMQARHGNGNGNGKSLAIEAQRLLPTPMVGSSAPAAHGQISGQYRAAMDEALGRWGDYAAAIARWEHVMGRPAPAPTMTSTKGNPQLAPAFVEWMMGIPAGWVTDVPGVTRNEALKALGNGVVPQQAAAALAEMLTWDVAA